MTTDELRAHDKEMLCLHEAGHCVVAWHFGLFASFKLNEVGKPTLENHAFTGRAMFWPTTKFREAVIGWAGVVAEAMQGRTHAEWQEEAECLWDYYSLLETDLSDTDREAIFGHPMRYRAFTTAVRILSKRFSEVQSAAARAIETGEL